MNNRQTHRLDGYDYSSNGAYFITIVTQDRISRFGEIIRGKMVLNDAGKMVESEWNDMANRFPVVQLDSFVVMPNHIHGIIVIHNSKGEHKVRPYTNDNCPEMEDHPTGTLPNTIGRIIQAFKSCTTHRYSNGVKMGLVPPYRKHLWQRDYHDHIIRNESEYRKFHEYIITNPQSWEDDSLKNSSNEQFKPGKLSSSIWGKDRQR